MFSIGKLAKISNTTVRTLRYYDEIGLLKPKMTSEGGHRYYDSEEVERLQNILVLKELGFELDTIHEILSNKVKSSKELLHLRLEILQEELHQLKQQEEKIKGILQITDMEGTKNWEDIFNTVSNTQNYNHEEIALRWENYFTQEEQEILNQIPHFGSKDVLIQKWVELIEDIKRNIHLQPQSTEAQKLAKRWLQLVYVMYKGDWKLAQKVWDINWERKEDLGFYQFEPDIIDFIREAQEYFFKENINSIKQVIAYE